MSTVAGVLIDGAWSQGTTSSQRTDRWTGKPLAHLSTGGAGEASAAVDAAAAALRRSLPPAQRSAVLRRTSELIHADLERFARSIQQETGKPITAARTEVERAVGTFAWAAEEARRLPGERIALEATAAGEGLLGFTLPQARGVVAAITPFNFPLNLVAHKVGPALAAGCPVVLKPSDKAPLVAVLLAQALQQAGLEPGWLNIVNGPAEPIVDTWLQDPRVSVVNFTGSADVGWDLKARSPRKFHILELGSNTAMYVHHDADLERAATDAAAAGYANSGQACISLQRLYVHTDIADSFTAALVAKVGELRTGPPDLASTTVGPLISEQAAARVASWVQLAQERGAQVLTGGLSPEGLLTPTVVSGVQEQDPLLCQEVFGPVVCMVTVGSLDEVVERINDSRFGLNTSIYTAALSEAFDFAARVQSGTALVNVSPSFRADHMPYGGVKDSGQGREGVRYAVQEHLDMKLVVIRP